MSVDQSHVDLLNLIPVHAKKVASTGGGEYHSPCPFCGGRDRFIIQPKNGRWMCRQCDKRGDAIAFVMEYHGKDFKSACEHLRLNLPDKPTRSRERARRAPAPPPISTAQEAPKPADDELWQERATAFRDYAEAQMWSQDATGRDYLMGRGFTEDTINHFWLGYNPHDVRDNSWGLDKTVWLPRGVVIPYVWGGRCELPKIRVRLLEQGLINRAGKYIPPKGVKNVMWMSRGVLPGDVVVMCEGEFDAMLIKQECPEPRIVSVATGGVTGARLTESLFSLSVASKILVAFDNESHIEQHAQWWLDRLPQAKRLYPLEKDVNDMLLKGKDVKGWVYGALAKR